MELCRINQGGEKLAMAADDRHLSRDGTADGTVVLPWPRTILHVLRGGGRSSSFSIPSRHGSRICGLCCDSGVTIDPAGAHPLVTTPRAKTTARPACRRITRSDSSSRTPPVEKNGARLANLTPHGGLT